MQNPYGMKDKWLKQGYADFAKMGPHNLSVSQIGKQIGTSRSSFYHHFGDLEFFIDELLTVHWEICQEFDRSAQKNCKKLIPDLYRELAKHPVSLRFHIQLFRNRSYPRYNYLFLKSFESSARKFGLALFAEILKPNLPEKDIYNLWLTLCEAWYSHLDPNDLRAITLQCEGEKVLKSVAFFMDSKLFRHMEE